MSAAKKVPDHVHPQPKTTAMMTAHAAAREKLALALTARQQKFCDTEIAYRKMHLFPTKHAAVTAVAIAIARQYAEIAVSVEFVKDEGRLVLRPREGSAYQWADTAYQESDPAKVDRSGSVKAWRGWLEKSTAEMIQHVDRLTSSIWMHDWPSAEVLAGFIAGVTAQVPSVTSALGPSAMASPETSFDPDMVPLRPVLPAYPDRLVVVQKFIPDWIGGQPIVVEVGTVVKVHGRGQLPRTWEVTIPGDVKVSRDISGRYLDRLP